MDLVRKLDRCIQEWSLHPLFEVSSINCEMKIRGVEKSKWDHLQKTKKIKSDVRVCVLCIWTFCASGGSKLVTLSTSSAGQPKTEATPARVALIYEMFESRLCANETPLCVMSTSRWGKILE